MAPAPMDASNEILELVELFEGLGPNVTGSGVTKRVQAYMAPEGQLTIGLGHVIVAGEEKTYLGGMTVAQAHGMYKTDRKQFLQRSAALTLVQVHELKRRDIARFTGNLNKWMEANKVKLSQRMFDVLIDLSFNAGEGAWNGTLKKNLVTEKNEAVAALFLPMFVMASNVYSRKLKRSVSQASPVSGLTFRRFSMVWFYFTGEKWRIANWIDWQIFLEKLNLILKAKNIVNPLPYKRNRKESQIDL